MLSSRRNDSRYWRLRMDLAISVVAILLYARSHGVASVSERLGFAIQSAAPRLLASESSTSNALQSNCCPFA
jgi:hypothetical protein